MNLMCLGPEFFWQLLAVLLMFSAFITGLIIMLIAILNRRMQKHADYISIQSPRTR